MTRDSISYSPRTLDSRPVRGVDLHVLDGTGMHSDGRAHGRVNTAWIVSVLFDPTVPNRFQVRPNSTWLTWTSASSQTSLLPWTVATASKVSGRVRSRTVSMPVTVTRCPDGRIPSALKIMSGLLALSKKSAERRWVSRLVFLVSMDAAATAIVPLTSPSEETVPYPWISRN